MKKFLNKKLNKKGFTLAEMLIVVAIIAILVAIAIPIFTSQLNKAKIARDNANIRAVKAAAITAIMDEKKGADLTTETAWDAIGTLDKDYNITKVTYTACDKTAESPHGDSDGIAEAGKIEYGNAANDGTEIKVHIASADITTN